MYTISLWASRHFWLARIVLIGALSLSTELALFIGMQLGFFEVYIPVPLFYTALAVFLAVFLIYPDRLLRHRFKNFYRYQKTCDGFLLATTFFMILCIGNRPERLLSFAQPAAAAITTAPVSNPELGKEKTGLFSVKKFSKKAFSKALIQKIKHLRKAYKATSTAGKVALIILSVVVALALLYLVAGLACSIACSGAEGLAIVLGIVGGGLVIFFLIRVIRRILKKPNPDGKMPEPAT